MPTYEEIEKKEDCACGVIKYTQEEIEEHTKQEIEKYNNEIIEVSYSYYNYMKSMNTNILNKFKESAEPLNLELNEERQIEKIFDNECGYYFLYEKLTIILKGKRKEIEDFEKMEEEFSFPESLAIHFTLEYYSLDSYKEFKSSVINEGFEFTVLESKDREGFIQVQVSGEKNKLEIWIENLDNSIVTTSGKVDGEWLENIIYITADKYDVNIEKSIWTNKFTATGKRKQVMRFADELNAKYHY